MDASREGVLSSKIHAFGIENWFVIFTVSFLSDQYTLCPSQALGAPVM